jgi:3-deoxy-D-arabino-heptulosonate 7-phosphate (DAHP) synthase class II
MFQCDPMVLVQINYSHEACTRQIICILGEVCAKPEMASSLGSSP